MAKVMTEISQETKTLITIIRHITLVKSRLHHISERLLARAMLHDLSKFREDEFRSFVEINRISREHPYGSEEYKNSLEGNKAIELHFSRNSHHPEYHQTGVDDMGLLDMIEMTVDWLAASETYGNTNFEDVLKIQEERFKLTPEQIYLIKLIVKEF